MCWWTTRDFGFMNTYRKTSKWALKANQSSYVPSLLRPLSFYIIYTHTHMHTHTQSLSLYTYTHYWCILLICYSIVSRTTRDTSRSHWCGDMCVSACWFSPYSKSLGGSMLKTFKRLKGIELPSIAQVFMYLAPLSCSCRMFVFLNCDGSLILQRHGK